MFALKVFLKKMGWLVMKIRAVSLETVFFYLIFLRNFQC